jgi:hypothetical protein
MIITIIIRFLVTNNIALVHFLALIASADGSSSSSVISRHHGPTIVLRADTNSPDAGGQWLSRSSQIPTTVISASSGTPFSITPPSPAQSSDSCWSLEACKSVVTDFASAYSVAGHLSDPSPLDSSRDGAKSQMFKAELCTNRNYKELAVLTLSIGLANEHSELCPVIPRNHRHHWAHVLNASVAKAWL